MIRMVNYLLLKWIDILGRNISILFGNVDFKNSEIKYWNINANELTVRSG